MCLSVDVYPGKTYTMIGDLRDNTQAGIIPRSVKDLFDQLSARGGPSKISVSFLEVYNEQMTDPLIASESARPLKLVEEAACAAACLQCSVAMAWYASPKQVHCRRPGLRGDAATGRNGGVSWGAKHWCTAT